MSGVAGMARAYAGWRASTLGRITDRLEDVLLRDLLGDVAGRAVLDLGCGDGKLAVRLAALGARVVGLDPDPAMLRAAASVGGCWPACCWDWVPRWCIRH